MEGRKHKGMERKKGERKRREIKKRGERDVDVCKRDKERQIKEKD